MMTKEFIGDTTGNLKGLKVSEIEWTQRESGESSFSEIPGSETIIPCELALLALGFLHPQHPGPLDQLGVEYDDRGNVKCANYQTSIEGVFSAGDMRRGQSLVVWAISEGREAARVVDKFLCGVSYLESKEVSMLSTI